MKASSGFSLDYVQAAPLHTSRQEPNCLCACWTYSLAPPHCRCSTIPPLGRGGPSALLTAPSAFPEAHRARASGDLSVSCLNALRQDGRPPSLRPALQVVVVPGLVHILQRRLHPFQCLHPLPRSGQVSGHACACACAVPRCPWAKGWPVSATSEPTQFTTQAICLCAAPCLCTRGHVFNNGVKSKHDERTIATWPLMQAARILHVRACVWCAVAAPLMGGSAPAGADTSTCKNDDAWWLIVQFEFKV